MEENNDATVLDETVKNLIISHLEALHTEFARYFPEITSLHLTLVSNAFAATIEQCIPDGEDVAEEELITLRHDSGVKELFDNYSLSYFWCSMPESYPQVAKIALKRFISFPST